jgi:outer membrane receptor protein involved in Fe transport
MGEMMRRIKSTLAPLAACLALAGGAPASHAADAGDPEENLIEIVVTGSRLSSANTSSPSPIVVVDNEELLHQGTPRVEEFMNSLPQVNSTLTLSANGAGVAPLTGAATVDLRGIGAFRTLVLIDGRRAAPGDPINPSADLNTVPSALVKRVEVLTGGASAIYGSDAIAGVVNFILDTNYTGLKVDLEGGIYQGNNDRRDLQAIERAGGITPPTGTVFDGASGDLSIVYGKDLFGGSGHVTSYAGYRQTQAVSASRRDFAACTLGETGSSYQCLLDGTTRAGQFVPNGGAGTPLTLDTANGHAFRTLSAPGDYFNPAPYQDLQRPDKRYAAGIFANYKFNEAANLYTEAQYTDDKTTVRFEPSGTSITQYPAAPPPVTTVPPLPPVFGINCNNPLLSASQVNSLCTSAGLGPTDTAQVAIGRRNIEGGQRVDEFHHQSYRVVLGVKGEISDPWSYDVSVVHGRVNSRETLTNDVSQSRLANALNVVNVGGVATCQSVVDGTDPTCIPYNIYSVGGVTPAQVRYITAGGVNSGFAQRDIANAQLIGNLEKYGIKSPLANSGVGVAVGAEYRVEQVRYNPDAEYATGDLLATGATHPTEGRFHVSEVFAEFKLPLIEDQAWTKSLVFNASDRYARYSPQGNVNAFGTGLEWAPIGPVRLRGSVSRAVRAPNAYELFTSQLLFQPQGNDPCAGTFGPTATQTPTRSAAECAHTGVTAAQYGNIAPQSTINVTSGGNPKLKPETADSVTMGFVLTPFANFLFSADYWRIKVNGYVGPIPAESSLKACLDTGDPFVCSLVQRDANGSLSVGNGASAGRIIGTRLNTGSYGNSGVDFEGRYRLGMETLNANAGTLTFGFTGSLGLDNVINVNPVVPAFDCSGYYGPNCTSGGPTSPVPRWRHRLRTTWEAKSGFELSLNWRHIGHMRSEFTSGNPSLATNPAYPVDSEVGTYDYFDLDGSVDLTPHLNLRLGINNLADRKAPIIGYYANPQLVNGNMTAGTYDTFGRYLFAGITAKY